MSLRDAVEALYARYVEILDEGPISELPSLFMTEGSYRAVTRENIERGWPLALMLCESRAAIEDRVYAIQNLALTIPRRVRHLVSGITLNEEGAQIRVGANFAVFETLVGEQTVTFAAGRYRDVLVREDGVLRFMEKVSIADSGIVRNSLVYPL